MEKDYSKSVTPFVSVIVPVFNAEQHIERTLSALEGQDYPRDRYEIIVIDNESEDNTQKLLEKFNVKLLVNSVAKNPYVSRNMGLEISKGEIIALIDVTCTPVKDWIKEGVKLIEQGADLVGGNIQFTFSKSPTLGEWYDSITYVNVKKYIEKFNGAAGGNLFVKHSVYESIGPFPEDGRSGMDMFWTRKATGSCFSLVYGEQAVAYYPARSLSGVLSKAYRVGKGQIRAWLKEERSSGSIWWEILKTYSPPSFKELQKNIKERGTAEMNDYFIHLWCINWVSKIILGLGRTVEMLELKSKLKAD